MMYWDHGDQWGWMTIVMPLFWLAMIGITVWAVARLTRDAESRGSGHARTPEHRESPEEILDRRFATGEIDAEAHAAARQQLAAHRH